MEKIPTRKEQNALKISMAQKALKAMEVIVEERLDGFQVVEEGHRIGFAV
jgi:hypothetical protein